MSYKKFIVTLLITYVLVLIVNITANYELYRKGEYWQYSIPFSLGVATLGWGGYVLLYRLVFSKYLNVTKYPDRSFFMSIILSGLYGALLIIAVMKLLVYFFHRPEQSFYNYTNNAIYAAMFAMLIGLMVNGQGFLRQLKTSAEENERMKKEVLRGQFETLKNQVNPHFFFNSLNTLSVLIPEQPGIAVSFVQQLSKVFRYSLQTNNAMTVQLLTELQVVQAYIFLNEQRFGNKLTVRLFIDENTRQSYIIPHALLMLVENAIKHNEISKAYPLTVDIYVEGGYLTVANTYQPKSNREISTGIGLKNITDRYRLLTPQPVVIEVNDRFTVKIPVLEHEHPAD